MHDKEMKEANPDVMKAAPISEFRGETKHTKCKDNQHKMIYHLL